MYELLRYSVLFVSPKEPPTFKILFPQIISVALQELIGHQKSSVS